MEWIKKNWFWLVVAAAIIFLFFYLKKGKETNSSYLRIQDPTIPTRLWAEQTLKNGITNFEVFKQRALEHGFNVLEKGESHTMEYNPRRIIVETVWAAGPAIACFMSPCPQPSPYKVINKILSVG